jgi:hypothetical protein
VSKHLSVPSSCQLCRSLERGSGKSAPNEIGYVSEEPRDEEGESQSIHTRIAPVLVQLGRLCSEPCDDGRDPERGRDVLAREVLHQAQG